MKRICLFLIALSTLAAEAKVQLLAREPYVGALVLDASTGQVLFADRADTLAYPASVLKLMDLLIIIEKVEQGRLRYDEPVRVTAEAARTGGSQVYLKEHEVFSVEDLLYALMIQSANDAAVALAIHVAGSKEAFVGLMNEKARELGMNSTRFSSVHGLPPAPGQEPDVTTARDLSLLCLELLKHPDVLKFTSTRERAFRTDAKEPFIMRNHNRLMGKVEGVDGFKTGFFSAAGFSIAATAKRGEDRVIAIVLGSAVREKRDEKAAELLRKGFLTLPPKPPPPPPPPAVTLPPPQPMPAAERSHTGGGAWKPIAGGVLIGLGLSAIVWAALRWKRGAKADFVRRS